MVDRFPNDQQDRLASRLKQEARAARPTFSETLHGRICHAVRDEKAVVQRRPAPSRWRPRLASLAAAAAVLLSTSLTAWWLSRPANRDPRLVETPDPKSADPVVLANATGRAAEHLGMLVDSTLTRQQWAYLDHDVQVAARLLFEQLPLDDEQPE